MNTQDEMFHEDFRDSLRHLVKALGGMEAAGERLWPNKSRKAAGTWLSDCLNPERDAKLCVFEELPALLQMGREKGVHCGIAFLCDSLNYTRPTTIEPEDTMAEVERQMDRHVEKIGDLVKQYERARTAETLKVVGR